MPGIKGRSGRRGYLEEKTAKEIVCMSSATILKALKDETLDLQVRSDLAKHFVLKCMPQIVEVDSQEEVILKLAVGTIVNENNRLNKMLDAIHS